MTQFNQISLSVLLLILSLRRRALKILAKNSRKSKTWFPEGDIIQDTVYYKNIADIARF